MNNIKNQRGFATLEIILVLSIIGIFSGVAVPKMARILDKVCLDYEMKHLYSDLNFARSLGKSSTFGVGAGALSGIEADGVGEISFWIYHNDYSNVSARNRYQIMRTSISSSPYYRHNLSNGVKIEIKTNGTAKKLTFNHRTRYDNWSQTVDINVNELKNQKTGAIVFFDSVGRWRGTYYE